MKDGLCIPVTHPVGTRLLRQVHSLGYRSVRVDLSEDHDQATEQLREAVDVPELDFDFLLFHGTMTRRNGEPWTQGAMVLHVQDTMIKMRDLGLLVRDRMPALEIGNEPDLAHERWSRSPEDLATVFAACYRTARSFSPRMPILTPSVSNLNTRGIAYLAAMYRAKTASGKQEIPIAAECAIHRYPHDGEAGKPHEGFESRDREVARLKEIIGGRPYHVTEYGFANYQYRGEYTGDQTVALYYEREREFWKRHGAASLFVYQINSGRYSSEASDDEKRMATYGVRGVDGAWKPIVEKVGKV